MKFLAALIIVLVGAGFWLTYDSVSSLKDEDSSTIKSLQSKVKDLENKLQEESVKSKAIADSAAKNEELSQLKIKLSELENKKDTQMQATIDELKLKMEELTKKDTLNACDQCAVEKCIAAQKKKLEPAPVKKTVYKPYKKPECPNKNLVNKCIEDRLAEWKLVCKITTTPEKVKSSFLSSEKQINKNVKKEKETIIVSLEPGTTKVPDLALCLKNKDDMTKECNLKHCAGY